MAKEGEGKPSFSILPFILAGCAVTQPAKTPANTGNNEKLVYPNNLWLALGTEPYWNKEVEAENQIVFTSIAGINSMAFKKVPGA